MQQPLWPELQRTVKMKDVYRLYYSKATTPADRSSVFCRLLELIRLNESPQQLQTSTFDDVSGWVEQNLTEMSPESLMYLLEAVARLPVTQQAKFKSLVRATANIVPAN